MVSRRVIFQVEQASASYLDGLFPFPNTPAKDVVWAGNTLKKGSLPLLQKNSEKYATIERHKSLQHFVAQMDV